MKVFWTSIILFTLLIIAIIFNSLYMHRTAESAQEVLISLDEAETRTERIAALEKIWETNRDRIEFTVGARKVIRIDELFTKLKWTNASGNESEFQATRSLLISAMEELLHNETLSLSAIF